MIEKGMGVWAGLVATHGSVAYPALDDGLRRRVDPNAAGTVDHAIANDGLREEG